MRPRPGHSGDSPTGRREPRSVPALASKCQRKGCSAQPGWPTPERTTLADFEKARRALMRWAHKRLPRGAVEEIVDDALGTAFLHAGKPWRGGKLTLGVAWRIAHHLTAAWHRRKHHKPGPLPDNLDADMLAQGPSQAQRLRSRLETLLPTLGPRLSPRQAELVDLVLTGRATSFKATCSHMHMSRKDLLAVCRGLQKKILKLLSENPPPRDS